MKLSKILRCVVIYPLVFGLMIILAVSCSKSTKIIVQDMNMQVPSGEQIFSEEMLHGEISDTKIEHFAVSGPAVQTISLSSENVNMFVFIKGTGILKADTLSIGLVPESLAIPVQYKNVTINVAEGEVLHYVRFIKKLSEQDKKDMEEFPDKNKYNIYFTKFSDCQPYTEKIKSPNTVSRMVLPGDIIPRVALGTVKASGPDRVGSHIHAMLDQLFLGLAGNDITVRADGTSIKLGEFSLLHIPLGSAHGVSVEKNKQMYYLWMDFFLSKEGQVWLKTHKPVAVDDK